MPGGDEEGDISGLEGSEPTSEMGGEPSQEGGGTPMESVNNNKPLITELRRNSYKKSLRDSEIKVNMLFSKYLKHLNDLNESKKQEISIEKADIYDKSLLINEEFNKMIEGLEKKLNEEKND